MIVFILLIGFILPVVIGTWAGIRAKTPGGAFFLGFFSTLGAAIAVALMLLVLSESLLATVVAVELPIISLFQGAISGTVAAIIVKLRASKPANEIPLTHEG